MGLDITFSQHKKLVCPKCGEVVGSKEIREVYSGGRAWYDFLKAIGYYVPYEKRTAENDWYGKDMELTTEQARYAYSYAQEQEVHNWNEVCGLIATSIFDDDCVVINADW